MTQLPNNNPVAIFSRLLDPEKIELSPEAANCLLKVTFDQADQDRMHELAVKNQKGGLTAEEEAEFESYLQVGCLLDVMHAKARIALKKSVATT